MLKPKAENPGLILPGFIFSHLLKAKKAITTNSNAAPAVK